MNITAPSSGAGAACRPDQYTSAAHSANNLLSRLMSACSTKTKRPLLERSRWGTLELCREALRKRDFAEARTRYETLLQKAKAKHDCRTAAKVMCDLAYLQRLLGETAEADALYKEAYKEWKNLVVLPRSSAMLDYIHCLLDYGAFLRKDGRLADALQLEARVEQINPQTLNPYFAISRADLLEARGQDREAAEYYEQALLDVTMKHDLDLQLRILDKLVPLYLRLEHLQLAENMAYRRQQLRRNKNARLWDRTSA
jgi:tetratricopeptide (TPR) repeat protein